MERKKRKQLVDHLINDISENFQNSQAPIINESIEIELLENELRELKHENWTEEKK